MLDHPQVVEAVILAVFGGIIGWYAGFLVQIVIEKMTDSSRRGK